MALCTHEEDLSNETVTASEKEIENKCTTKVIVLDPHIIYNHEFSQILHQDMEAHESIIATETTAEIPLHDSTMESEIDNTAELVPSGRIQSHQFGIKTAVSETSPPQLTSMLFNPKASDDLSENQPSSLPLTYSQEKHFNQLCRTESTKKLAQPSLEQSDGVLDMGKRDTIIADLYSEGAYGTHFETPDSFQNISATKSDDKDNEDFYTDLYEAMLTQKNELSREIRSNMELTGDIPFKCKVWHVPNPAKIQRKADGMNLDSENDNHIGSKKHDYIETAHEKTEEETLMFRSSKHGSHTNGMLGQHATTDQTFVYVSALQQSNVTNDIGLENTAKVMQENVAEEDNPITVKYDDLYADQTQKVTYHVCEEVNQCESETTNHKRQKDEVHLKTVNYMNHQKLKIQSNAIKLFHENVSPKETYNNISGITSMYPLNVSKVVSSQETISCVEDTSDKVTDNLPRSSSYDGESQRYTQLNIPTFASQKNKPLTLQNTEIQPQICSNSVVIDSIENHGENESAINIKEGMARNNATDLLEFQRNGDLSTMCPENLDTGQSTTILKKLISGQAHGINGITMESLSKSLKKDNPDARMKTLGDEVHEKHEPSEKHQVSYSEFIDEQDKHYSRDDNDIKEVSKKPCHSHSKNSETDSQKKSPEKEAAFGSVLQTKPDRDKETVTSSKIISNERLKINNVHTQSNSFDPAINSSQLTIMPTCTLTNATTVLTTCLSDSSYPIKTASPGQYYQYMSPFSDPSQQTPETFPDVPNQCTNISLDSLYQNKTMCQDPHDEGQTTYSDSMYQSKSNSLNLPYKPPITSDDSPNHSAATISNSPNHCTISPLDPLPQCRTTVPELCFESRISCLAPPDQCTPISHSSTYHGNNNSSNSSALCTKTSSDPSDQCKTAIPDSFYQDKINSLDTTDQWSTMSPETTPQCSVTFLNPSDQSKTSSPDFTNQCKNNSSDLSYQFISASSDLFNNQNMSPPDPSNQGTPSTLDTALQCKNNSSDQSCCDKISPFNPSHQCRTTVQKYSFQTCLGSSDPFTTMSHNSTYQGANISSTTSDSSDQGKINSLDTSDQCTTMLPNSAQHCSVISPNVSDQCKTSFPDSTNQCKNNSPDLSHQFTITSCELSNQCPTIALNSSDECRITPGDPTTKYITTTLDLPSCDFSNQSAINDSVLSKHTTVPDLSAQCGIPSLDPIGQCTIITPDPNNSQSSSYQYKIISSGQSDQCTTIALNSPDECNTISLGSSNYMFSISDSGYQHTSSQTSSHNAIINSSDSSNPCTNDTSEPSCQTALPDLSNQCIANPQNLQLLWKISSDQSLNVSTSTCPLLDSCTTFSSDPDYEWKTTTSNHENMVTSHEFSHLCTTDFSNGRYQFTNSSPNQHDHHEDNSVDPCSQCTTCATESNHWCISAPINASCHCITYPCYHTISNYDSCNQWTTNSPNLPQQSSTSSPDLCISTANLPDRSEDILGDPDVPCTAISLTPSYQDTSTSAESSDQCTNISVDCQLSLPCENNKDCVPLRKPIQDKYGFILKQRECSFLGEVRRIYLDNQNAGFSLLDSGIILTERIYHFKNLIMMMLWDGKELGTIIRSSKLFLYYQLGKHFYVTQQLNEDWYHTQDRITKVTMLMKKVPITSNWLKMLHNFLCLPNDCRLLIPYAVLTDRNGSILFLMEDRDILSVGIPPPVYLLNTENNLSRVLCFMKFCRIHRVLPRKIKTSILFTTQGICFDPSGLCNNDDLCEFKKCLKEYLLVFLFNGQQEEFNGTEWEQLLERAQLLLEEDWSPQICLARLLSTTTQGALPFSLPSSSNEN